jgi:hypothetical protein
MNGYNQIKRMNELLLMNNLLADCKLKNRLNEQDFLSYRES